MSDANAKNFNDDELDDIMSEIESLEKEFVAPEESAPQESPEGQLNMSSAEPSPEANPEPAPIAEDLGDDLGDLEKELSELESEMNDAAPDLDDIEEELEALSELDIPEAEEQVVQEAPSSPVKEEVAPVESVVQKVTPTQERPVAEEEPVKQEPVAQTPSATVTPIKLDAATGGVNLNLNFSIGNTPANLWLDGEKGLSFTMSGVKVSIDENEGCVISMKGGAKFTIPLDSEGNSLKKAS